MDGLRTVNSFPCITTIRTMSTKTQPITKIQHTWISSGKACTMIIAKELAIKHGLTEPSNVILEDRPDGILIRKLNIDDLSKRNRSLNWN
jgi:hypothetical protein